MAKIFVTFENEFIDLYQIKSVTKKNVFDEKKKAMSFQIVINEKFIDSLPMLPIYVFSYQTEELRENKIDLLKIQLEEEDRVIFL